MAEPTVFISYSHRDEAEKNLLLTHLGVLQSHGLLTLWSDDRISGGGDWEDDIEEAMDQAKIAILLVTANFLTSKFILEHEVRRLLERRRDEGLIVFPVIAKPCAWQSVKWLTRMNVRPKNGTPIWREGGIYADDELAKIATEVHRLLNEPSTAPPPGVGLEDLLDPTPPLNDEPVSKPVGPMSIQQKMTLVNALLEVGAIKDRATRDTVINELPPSLKNNIQRHAADRTDVMNIVSTCMNYANGLQQLVEVLVIYEGDSLPMQKVKQLVS
jgi:hypothetical protein